MEYFSLSCSQQTTLLEHKEKPPWKITLLTNVTFICKWPQRN